MSAIAGIYHWNDEPVNLSDGLRIMEGLQKYPADDIQTWHNKHVFLGCHAQWITPESINEQLPLYDLSRGLSITADAIIDNRSELFHLLSIEPVRRAAMSDSELILHAYCKWGTDTPEHLIGEFAFIIWDERKRQLFAARDFSGARTLYYCHAAGRIALCTVINPLFVLPYVKKQVNESWMAEFLAIPNMIDTIDAQATVYEGIEQIPPSHSIIVNQSGIQLARYSMIEVKEPLRLQSDLEYEEAFRSMLQRSVSDRLRTHRQVGSHLSGGLDSGAVASFAAKSLQERQKPLFTYSYVPEDDFVDWTPKYKVPDEREYMKSTAEFAGNMRAHYLDFPGRDSYQEIDEWLETVEMPYKSFENSFWVRGIYEKASQQNVGILLNGARGNFTISWGPALEYYASLMKRLQWIRLYREVNVYSHLQEASISRILTVVGKKAFPFLSKIATSDYRMRMPRLISAELAQKTQVYEKMLAHGLNEVGFTSNDIYKFRNEHFQQDFVWNATGTYGSKMSLRYKLWQRDPCNDPRVINFCLSIPQEQFVRDGFGRALIRRSTQGYLPDKVRLNQQVRGIQGADWVHRMTSHWRSFGEELETMRQDKEFGYFVDMPAIEQGITKIKAGANTAFTFDPDIRILMRALIVHRFLQSFR